MSSASRPSELDLAGVMLDQLAVGGRAEIERALRLTLFAPPSVMEQRVADLSPLAAMLDQTAAAAGWVAPRHRLVFGEQLTDDQVDECIHQPIPHAPAEDYDAHRPGDAPSSRHLTARFGGSWRGACRAVWGLMVDGRYAGAGRPWASGVAGKPRLRYTNEECVAAVRACALRFGRIPTVTLYQDWRRQRIAHARRVRAQRPMLPTYRSFNDRWGGWPGTLRAADISERELLRARQQLASVNPILMTAPALAPVDCGPGPAAVLMDISDARLEAAGLEPRFVRRVAKRRFAALEISQACTTAQVLDGSVDWLAGRTRDRGQTPVVAAGLSAAALRELRMTAGLNEQGLRAAVRMTLSEWRGALAGRRAVTLAEAATIAGCLDAAIAELIA